MAQSRIGGGAVASGFRRGGLEEAVASLQDAVVDPGSDVVEDPLPVAFDGSGQLFDRFQAAVAGSPVPAFQPHDPPARDLLVELLKEELQGVGPLGLAGVL